jgi:hypothetical protein
VKWGQRFKYVSQRDESAKPLRGRRPKGSPVHLVFPFWCVRTHLKSANRAPPSLICCFSPACTFLSISKISSPSALPHLSGCSRPALHSFTSLFHRCLHHNFSFHPVLSFMFFTIVFAMLNEPQLAGLVSITSLTLRRPTSQTALSVLHTTTLRIRHPRATHDTAQETEPVSRTVRRLITSASSLPSDRSFCLPPRPLLPLPLLSLRHARSHVPVVFIMLVSSMRPYQPFCERYATVVAHPPFQSCASNRAETVAEMLG